ncbi:SCO6880 family protein [Propionicicella superfundia]|uniref:SCO6880 family protein n=1 Tax=Propionicicella superfundia TaxID=348582 RepID=UPI000414017D|nr:SCO6880 family protein [Propionicicella superfundia]
MSTPVTRRTYGNWRITRSPGLGALGTVGTIMLLFGAICMIVALARFGLLGGGVVAVVVGAVLGLALRRDRHGRSVIDRLVTRVGWLRARAAGADLYRSGPLSRTPWGSTQLPGLAAALTLTEHTDSYGRQFALIHSPSQSTYTVVFTGDPDGGSLVDQETIDAWVASYGGWLAMLSDEPQLIGVAVTIETAPDSGIRLRQEVNAATSPSAPAFARAMLADILDSYPAGASTVRAHVALTFRGARASRDRDATEMGRDLAARLPGLSSTLEETGVRSVRPVTSADLCEHVRTAYDPAAEILFDRARQEGGGPPRLSWPDVGPAAAQASWDSYRHDGAVSTSWVMSAPPRDNVPSSILARLLAPRGDIARKRVTILYRPMDAGHAAARVEADKRTAEWTVNSARRPSARATRALQQATRTAEEEAAGAGLVDFGVVVTATVLAGDDLDELHATMDTLSAAARLTLRPAYGAQDVAFVTTLPLGILPHLHASPATRLREAL